MTTKSRFNTLTFSSWVHPKTVPLGPVDTLTATSTPVALTRGTIQSGLYKKPGEDRLFWEAMESHGSGHPCTVKVGLGKLTNKIGAPDGICLGDTRPKLLEERDGWTHFNAPQLSGRCLSESENDWPNTARNHFTELWFNVGYKSLIFRVSVVQKVYSELQEFFDDIPAKLARADRTPQEVAHIMKLWVAPEPWSHCIQVTTTLSGTDRAVTTVSKVADVGQSLAFLVANRYVATFAKQADGTTVLDFMTHLPAYIVASLAGFTVVANTDDSNVADMVDSPESWTSVEHFRQHLMFINPAAFRELAQGTKSLASPADSKNTDPIRTLV